MKQNFKVTFICLLDGDLVMNPEHVGVGYLMQVLRQAGYLCNVVELSRENHEEILQQIEEYNPNMVGFSLMSINKKHAAEFGRKIKARFPSIHICCGGPVATFGGERLMSSEDGDYIDSIVVGEGEETILELVEVLKKGDLPEGVLGVCYRDGDNIIANPRRQPVHDLDALPFPARDQFEMAGGNLEYIRISTSRGCTSKCTFCSAPNVSNRYTSGMKVWRGRSAKSVVEEIKYLVEKYKFYTFDFVDSTFEDPGKIGKQRIREIAQGIIDSGLEIYYNCCMQACNWHDEDRELISLLAKSGLEKVLVGIESGSDIGLQHWQKRSNVEDNRRVIRLLREQNIYVSFGFIMFHPHSTLQEIRENVEFLRENLGHNLRRFGTRLEVYPGTQIESILRAQGLLHEEYDRTLNCMAYDSVNKEIVEFANAFASMFGEEYEKNLVIHREPAVFKFETFDIVVHTYMSRLYRSYGHLSNVREILDDFKCKLHDIYRQITEFNYEIVNHALTALEKGCFHRSMFSNRAQEVEEYFSSKMNEINRLQMLTSRKLMRMNVDLSVINNRKKRGDQPKQAGVITS